VFRKICFLTYNKNKNPSPLKIYFAPSTTLKPGYGPGSAKIVSAMRIFVLKAIWPRDVA